MGADKRGSRAPRRPLITLPRVQQALGEAIEQLEHYVLAPAEAGERVNLDDLCKITYALAQAAGVFKTLTEAGALEELAELRERISAIESSTLRA
jgi:hypothetical protein